MTNESVYKKMSLCSIINVGKIKPVKMVFIKESLKYGGAMLALYLLTGIALRVFGVA